ncbi:MAG: hypothetical protein ACI83W_002713 [Marinoscillum sp.]|jgi:hypothetical protein
MRSHFIYLSISLITLLSISCNDLSFGGRNCVACSKSKLIEGKIPLRIIYESEGSVYDYYSGESFTLCDTSQLVSDTSNKVFDVIASTYERCTKGWFSNTRKISIHSFEYVRECLPEIIPSNENHVLLGNWFILNVKIPERNLVIPPCESKAQIHFTEGYNSYSIQLTSNTYSSYGINQFETKADTIIISQKCSQNLYENINPDEKFFLNAFCEILNEEDSLTKLIYSIDGNQMSIINFENEVQISLYQSVLD